MENPLKQEKWERKRYLQKQTYWRPGRHSGQHPQFQIEQKQFDLNIQLKSQFHIQHSSLFRVQAAYCVCAWHTERKPKKSNK